MKLGGRIAVMDDFGNGDELLRRFKIQRIRMPGRPVTALRQNPRAADRRAVAGDVEAAQIGPPHPVVSNVKRLVLNHPMALVHPDLSPVLKVRLAGSEGDAIVAVAGQVEKGRLFAMSDPSALINSMLRYPGNRAFAAGLVRYLANDAERGGGRLYIVANAYKQEGSVGGDRSMLQEAENALRSIADSLADIRKNGFPSGCSRSSRRSASPGWACGSAAPSGRPYRARSPATRAPTPLVARGGVAGRFAMLAAPSSPRGLVLLELKSALFEAMANRFDARAEPERRRRVKAVNRSGLVTTPRCSADCEQVDRAHAARGGVGRRRRRRQGSARGRRRGARRGEGGGRSVRSARRQAPADQNLRGPGLRAGASRRCRRFAADPWIRRRGLAFVIADEALVCGRRTRSDTNASTAPVSTSVPSPRPRSPQG